MFNSTLKGWQWLLAGSLILNVGFIFYSITGNVANADRDALIASAPPPRDMRGPGGFARLTEYTSLNDESRSKMRAIIDDALPELRKRVHASRRAQRAWDDALNTDGFDIAELKSLAQTMAQTRADQHYYAQEIFLDALAYLSPDMRHAVLEEKAQRHAARRERRSQGRDNRHRGDNP